MDELIGRTLRGYEIRGVIGLGGFGTVYRAHQSSVARDVAVKVISRQYASSVRFIQNFEREARLVARLEHPYIVPVYDYWRDPRGAYIVMRLLGGGSLEDDLRKNGPWSLERTATMLDQIGAALSEAHRNNVVHQDIKVANILLDQQGNAYLSDFGIAKELDQLETEIDEEQILSGNEQSVQPTVHGSPEYMSPEQILRMSVDPRTDIYSLGVVIYEVLTGEKAFTAEDDDALLRKQLYEKLPLLAGKRPGLTAAIDQILQKATSKHPRNRYTDMLEMAHEFRQAVISAEAQASVPVEIIPQPAMIERAAEPVNPYKGLLAFQEGDASDFYGREKLVDRLYLRLLEPGDDARFLAVVGPSGSGKSSVVRAGLLSMLRKNAPRWFIVEMTPDTEPFAQLTDAILRVAVDPDYPYDEIVRRGTDGLRTALTHALGDAKRQLVLVIDQFEELFTLTQDDEVRRLFIDGLLTALQPPDSQLRVIITLRADFMDRPLAYSGLGELIARRVEMVPTMSPEELRRAIEKPAERAGLKLEDGLLVQMITDAANQRNVLPLLQMALTTLYQARDERDQRLTLYAYSRNGGLTGAIEAQADGGLANLSDDERKTAEQLFLRLVTLGEGVEDTRRRIRRSSLNTPQIDQQNLEKILDQFSESRLLIFDRDLETREPTIEIAHEAMLKHWKTLRDWISSNRDALHIEQQLAQLTQQWQDHNRDTSFLATGARLQQFEELVGNPNVILQEPELQYLQASIDRRRRNQRRQTALSVAAVAAAVVFAILFIFAQSESQRASVALDNVENAQSTTVAERNRADDESRIALSRELSIRSLLDVPETDRRLLLSAAAVSIADTDAARNTLFTQLQNASLLNRFLHGPTTTLRTIAYSSNGQWIAASGADERVYLWDAATGALSDVILEQPGLIVSLAFNADSTRLVTGGEDGSVRLWSIPDGALASTAVDTEITQVAFSPDGSLVAAAGDNGSIIILNVSDAALDIQTRLEGHEGSVYALAFSPDGQTLASGGTDDVIRLWSIAEPESEPQILTGHSNWIWSLTYSPDGSMLASASFDQMVRLWNVAQDYTPLQTLEGHTNFVRSAIFSPNGRILASGGDDGRVILWNVQTGDPLSAIPFEGAQKIWSLAFNPTTTSGTPLAIAGDAPVVPLWNLSQEALVQSVDNLPQPARLLHFDAADDLWAYGNTTDDASTVDIGWLWSFADQNYTEKVTYDEPIDRITTAVALSSDGGLWASGDGDGVVKLFDPANGQPIGEPLQVSETGIYALVFSRDGNRLAAGDDTGQIHLWQRDGDTWALELTLDQHLDRVLTLAFSDDGRYLASGSLDNTAILWDLSGDSVTGTVLSSHTEAVMSVAFSPDAALLVTGGRDDMIAVWSVPERTLLQELRTHTDWVTTLTFSHDGQSFVSGSRDTTAILWSLREGAINPIGDRLSLGETVTAASFSVDDHRLALGGESGLLRVWQVDVADWVTTACRIANRSLTETETQTYLHGVEVAQLCQ